MNVPPPPRPARGLRDHIAVINRILAEMGIRLELADMSANIPVTYRHEIVEQTDAGLWPNALNVEQPLPCVHSLFYGFAPKSELLWNHYMGIFQEHRIDRGVYLDKLDQRVVARSGSELFVLDIGPNIRFVDRTWLKQLGPAAILTSPAS